MRSLTVLPLLCSVCVLLQSVISQKCDIENTAKRDVPFPVIEGKGVESYMMSVEYTAPKSKQTNYYTEYYDTVERRGKVEGHDSGQTRSYIYYTASYEAWEITGKTCVLKNLTDTPQLEKSDMIQWLYITQDDSLRTFGPSAMFKYGLETWNSEERQKNKNLMGYMGKAEGLVRGLEAQYWRRCDSPTSWIDYYFTTDTEEDPLGLGMKKIPLRVSFGGDRPGKMKELSVQDYEILNFQPFIPLDIQPFQLPVGRGCKRADDLKDVPTVPDFSDKNLQFSAEVIYRKVDRNGDDAQYWSYYSTLKMALDLTTEHLAYYYSPWNSTKPEKKDDEPTVTSPEYVIFDMKHGYAYKTNLVKGTCEIIREKNFAPKYKLPNNAGELTLTDPSILFPNNELTFITEGENRGLKVNVYEEIVENYLLDNTTNLKFPNAIISHSYLKDNEVERNKASVKNALTQVQLRLSGRFENIVEMLTFNFYGFSTELTAKRFTFNVMRCFKNDDDYSWITIGFNADKAVLENIREDIPNIQSEMLNAITMHTELNEVRIPIILVDINDGVFVTMLILGKPPVLLDYLEPEDGKVIIGSNEEEGNKDINTCATECLETEDNCWGFSLCGGVCTFGVGSTAKAGNKAGCKLYRRYDNTTFIPSRALMIENIRREIETNQVTLVLKGKNDELVQLQATSIEVTDPGEDEHLFDRLGNEVSPRMRVVKAGAKLKEIAGTPVKNLGKLRFDECQRICLDFKDCESMSYCLKDSTCMISSKYGEDLKDLMVTDNMCSVLTRKYADNFVRSPGNVLSLTAKEVLDLDTVEKCARACLKSTGYQCRSFDHCPQDAKGGCKLHTVHYPSAKTREAIQTRSTNCGHYYRKYSTEFRKTPNKRYAGSKLVPLSNMTLEECAVACIEYGKGTCYGYDFCQDVTMYATSCVLLDTDPAQLKRTDAPFCTNYLRSEAEFSPRPYSAGYAGGIGFLCFFVGLVVGAVVVFTIAYIKVNRR